jgi:fatty acid desaturase
MDDAARNDHRMALAAIGDSRMAMLAETSDGPGLSRILGHVGLLMLTGTAVLALDGWLRLPFQVIHGIVLVFLFSAAHECIHRTAFRSRRLNDAVAWFAGLPILLPPNAFRFFHFAHHRHTQDPLRDPELATRKPRTRAAYLFRLSGWHYWSGQAAALLGAASGKPLPRYVPPGGEHRVRVDAQRYLAVYAAVAALSFATGSTAALTLWIVPALLGQPALRAYLMAEHTACPMVPDMLANTRTTFCHRAIRWLAWEMPWHTAHHAAPMVPFHRLEALTGEIRDHLRSTADGYPDAHRQILAAIGARR